MCRVGCVRNNYVISCISLPTSEDPLSLSPLSLSFFSLTIQLDIQQPNGRRRSHRTGPHPPTHQAALKRDTEETDPSRERQSPLKSLFPGPTDRLIVIHPSCNRRESTMYVDHPCFSVQSPTLSCFRPRLTMHSCPPPPIRTRRTSYPPLHPTGRQHSQHHRLAPNPAPSNPSVLSGGSNPRLNEFFDLIKGEFEAASQDGGVWKQQRDEYEQKSEWMTTSVHKPTEMRSGEGGRGDG